MNLKPESFKSHPTAISTWNTDLVTQDHVNLEFLSAKQNDIGELLQIRINLQVTEKNIREHFKNLYYPDSVVDQAIAKAAQLSTDEAIQPTTKSDSDVIPFVCTFNPSLANIGKTVNQYWGLFKNSVKEIVKCRPVIEYKRPSNLQDILVHSHLNRTVNKDCKISKCCRARCTHCKYITESKHFSSSVLCRYFKVKHTCSSSDVIYLITCKNVNYNMLARPVKHAVFE